MTLTVRRRAAAVLMSLMLAVGAATVAEAQTQELAPVTTEITRPVPLPTPIPFPDCSQCEARLARALHALEEARKTNARQSLTIQRLQKRIVRCNRDRRECRNDLAASQKHLAECRVKLQHCADGAEACKARLVRCAEHLGECRHELSECRGDQCCDAALEPGTGDNPVCFEGATCCGDGSWACNNGDGSDSCAGPVGEVCEACCDPAREPGANGTPFCIEGATCCGDGSWRCNEGDGSATCDGPIGVVCEEPMGCDPRLEPGVGGNPFCFEGATCCADGRWSCNNGDGSPSCRPLADHADVLESAVR